MTDLDAELTALFEGQDGTSGTTEALARIDNALREISGRTLVPVGEMTDLLLDVRLAVAGTPRSETLS